MGYLNSFPQQSFPHCLLRAWHGSQAVGTRGKWDATQFSGRPLRSGGGRPHDRNTGRRWVKDMVEARGSASVKDESPFQPGRVKADFLERRSSDQGPEEERGGTALQEKVRERGFQERDRSRKGNVARAEQGMSRKCRLPGFCQRTFHWANDGNRGEDPGRISDLDICPGLEESHLGVPGEESGSNSRPVLPPTRCGSLGKSLESHRPSFRCAPPPSPATLGTWPQEEGPWGN